MVNKSIYFGKGPETFTYCLLDRGIDPATIVITTAAGGGHVTFLLSDGREEVSVERWVNKLALTWESILLFKESATVRAEPLSKSEYSASTKKNKLFCLFNDL